MKYFILLFCLLPALTFADVPFPRAATGLEAGVAQLSHNGDTLLAQSWAYHFEYEMDHHVGFFGQAGTSKGSDDDHEFKQNSFAGGLQLHLLPQIGFRLGAALNALEIDGDRSSEFGPLAAVTAFVPMGVFKLGTTATFIHTSSLQSAALRMMLLIVF